jgi:hypothetical protein
MPKPTASSARVDRYTQRYTHLRQQLQEVAYFSKGTVLERKMKCGQPGCVCHQDPSKRHGPYWEWTYKARGKTVNVKLDSETGPLYQAACQQYRKLKALLNRLERISRTALAAQAKQLKNRRTT